MDSTTNRDSFANIVFTAFKVVVVVLSATTSFGFFVDTFDLWGNIIPSLPDDVSRYLDGATGVFLAEGAALTFLFLRQRKTDNEATRTLATLGFVVGVFASALATGFFLLTASNMGGEAWVVGLVAPVTFAMIILVVAYFVILALWGKWAQGGKVTEQMTDLLADAQEEVAFLTREMFYDNLPALAERHARNMTRELARRTGTLSAMEAFEVSDDARASVAQKVAERRLQARNERAGGNAAEDDVDALEASPATSDAQVEEDVPFVGK